jgi:tripartite-type tricarboxylate transporter receptor subunit TctC
LKMPDVNEKLALDGSEAVGSTPAQFKEHIRTEVDKWRNLIQSAGITGG